MQNIDYDEAIKAAKAQGIDTRQHEAKLAQLRASGKLPQPVQQTQAQLPQQAQTQQPQNMQSMLNQIQPNLGMRLANGINLAVGGPGVTGAGANSSDLVKLYQQEAIKKQFENDPNSLDYQNKISQINARNAGLTLDESGNTIKVPTEASDYKKTEDYKKRLGLMNNDLDPSRYRSGAFGTSKQVFDRGERLQSLAEQAQGLQAGGADKRQMEEFAIGLNSMLSGSNQGAQQQVQALVPHTWWGGAQGIKEFLTNNPTGLDQKKFVDRMVDTINREMDTAKTQIDRTRFARLSKYRDILEGHKEDFEDTMRGYGMDPQQYYNWQQDGMPGIDAVQHVDPNVKTGGTPPKHTPEQIGMYNQLRASGVDKESARSQAFGE